MLAHYYADGLTIDAFRFDDVRADDPSIIGSEYVDVPAHALPELKGADFSWWKGLPPSGGLFLSGLYWYPTASSEFNSPPTTTLVHSPFIHGDSTIERPG